VAQSRLVQARAGEQQARAELQTAQTGPEQVAATKARAAAAEAHVQQAKATLAQAELNLQYATVKAPIKGIVSRKAVEVGQIVQPVPVKIVLDGGQDSEHLLRPGMSVVATVYTK